MINVFIIVIDCVLLLTILPLFRDYWWRDIIRGKKGDGSPKSPLRKKVVITLIFVAILCGIGYANYYRFRPRAVDLQYFSTDDYMDEVALSAEAGMAPGPGSIGPYQKLLLRELFARASYVANRGDLTEAIKVYEILDIGDYYGERIIVVSSSCVKNNLAILYYLSKPNDKEQFANAVSTLTAAKNLTEKEHLKKFRDKINRNYFILTIQD